MLAQLTSSQIQEQWVFDRLLANGNYASDLTPFVKWDSPPTITHDITNAVARRLRMTVRGDAPITVLSDQIRAHYQLRMPAGDVLDWPLGTFALVPNLRDIELATTWIDLEGYDFSQLLIDSELPQSAGFPAGTSYVQAIASIANFNPQANPLKIVIPDLGQKLPQALSWPYGTTRLSIINQLLDAIQYEQAWFDELGKLRANPLPDYNLAVASATFDATLANSIVIETIEDRPDVSRCFNQVLVVCEDPRRPPIFALYQNTRANDPVSMVNWHPKLLVVRMSHIADQATLLAAARNKTQEGARYYSNITVKTTAWPVSQNRDVYRVIYNTPQEGYQNWLYLEVGWEMQCGTGRPTTHILQRILPA